MTNSKEKDHYWIKSGFINLLQNLSGVFFGFGSFYFLVRVLTKYDFGVWTLFMSTITILEAVRSGLIQNALVKYISSSEKEEHPNIISASFTITAMITIFCIILTFIFGHYLSVLWKSPELELLLYLYTIIYLFSGVQAQFNCIEQANLRFDGIFVTNLIRQGLFFGYVCFSFFFVNKITLIHLLWVQIVSVFISTIVSYQYVKRDLKIAFNYNKEWISKLFSYGKYAFGTSISSLLSGTIDQMMLGALLSPAASGAFNIAVRITNLIDIPGNAIATIVFPQSSKRVENEGNDAIKYLYEKSVGTTLALVLPGVIFLFLFSNIVIHFIAGEKYDDAIPLLRVTLLYCLLIPYGRQFGTILDSVGRTRTTFLVVLTTATLNLTLNYFFIQSLGVIGAAYATLCSNVVGFIIAQTILKRIVNVSVWNTFIYAFRFYPEFFAKYIQPVYRSKFPKI